MTKETQAEGDARRRAFGKAYEAICNSPFNKPEPVRRAVGDGAYLSYRVGKMMAALEYCDQFARDIYFAAMMREWEDLQASMQGLFDALTPASVQVSRETSTKDAA